MYNFLKKFKSVKYSKTPEVYLSCRYLNYGISFMHTAIKSCCHSKEGINYYDNYKGEKINWNKIERIRKENIIACKQGIIPNTCNGCINLYVNKWDSSNKIKEIVINNWDHCNCGCIYCVYNAHGSYFQTEKQKSKYYDVLPHLKWLYKHNKISKFVKVVFVGGDLTLLEEADDIINLCLKNGIGLLFFHTSAINYSFGIEKALKSKYPVKMDFSIDCGSREMYKKIKRIDAFNNVLENIKKYINCSSSAQQSIISKYIIIKNLNDNIEELTKWIQLISSLGIKNTKLELDLREFDININKKKETVNENYYNMYKLYLNLIMKYNLKDESTPYTKLILKEGGLPKGYW